MASTSDLSHVLRHLMQRSGYAYTPGLLSKLSGVPKTTIVHWLEGRVSRPRYWQDLARVADALRLSEPEADLLLNSAGHPAIQELHVQCNAPQEQALLAGWPAVDGPAQALPAHKRPGNIPFLNQPLIGQASVFEAALAAIQAAQTRLLLVTGPGGVGKSLLTAHVARAAQASFADGVAWVTLDTVPQAAPLLPWLVHSLGVEASASISVEQLGAWLGERRILLVLDTCEHHVTALPQVVRLLRLAPQLRLVLTSRCKLALPAATSLHIEPLAVPGATMPADPARLAAFPAVALFVQRAGLVCPSFALTAANVADVAAICAYLDGLPLAIELAAARLKIMSPRELLTRIHGSSAGGLLQILASGKRNAPARQQTMRASIDWSYQLLPPESHRLLQQLAAHEADWSLAQILDKAHTVESKDSRSQTLQLLIDHHLVYIVGSQSGQPRFRLPVLIRDFVRTQLVPGADVATAEAAPLEREYEA